MCENERIQPLKKQKLEGSCPLPQLEAVLADKFTRTVCLDTFIACQILDKKKTSEIVKEISSRHPLEEYRHLKRVKSGKSRDEPLVLLVCPAAGVDEAPSLTQLQFDHEGLDLSALGPPSLVQVPRDQPLTRRQFESCSRYWPTSFHEDKNISRLLSGHFLNDEDLARAKKYMTQAVQAAVVGQQRGQVAAIGSVVVDPGTNDVIAVSYDVRGDHPLHHATMVAVDLVARHQGGGAYDFSAVEGFFVKEPTEASTKEKTGPYLCTGYDLYITHEPCLMCAMTLVHSRIRRVYYCLPTPDGALGTRYKLHVEEGLNHHYQVFKGLLRGDERLRELQPGSDHQPSKDIQ